MSNFIFISPNFPKTYYQFPKEWKQLGGTSLCIGEDPYDSLPQELKDSMNEYYQVGSMMDYDQMYRAVAWFAHKHGKIDWLESNNEFWLEQDARLRTDFNITTGDNTESVSRFKTKSNMKAFYEKANVPVARYHLTTTLEEGRKFIAETGYPVIVKPDNGVGANATWKISNDEQLEDFYKRDLPTQYIMEEFVPGYIVSFDGIADQNNNIIFKTSHVFPEPIMDVVNTKDELLYYSVRQIPEDLDEMGQRVIHAFGIRGRFFHTEYFRLTEDKKGLGRKGDLVGLEVNMRPPGGYTPEMMNYANDISVYRIYANMAMSNTNTCTTDRPYAAVHCGRRNHLSYKYDYAYLSEKYGSHICMHEIMPEILSSAMGNEAYIARFETEKEIMDFARDVFAKSDSEN
ncbi:MAG: ATP-grasp domain-containing protein [Solobacterium sp.]|nr:ATP-grasp domain-containing protein [Solobacterium sp.]